MGRSTFEDERRKVRTAPGGPLKDIPNAVDDEVMVCHFDLLEVEVKFTDIVGEEHGYELITSGRKVFEVRTC